MGNQGRPAPKVLVAKRYEILRNVCVGARAEHAISLPECPVRVATLIDEKSFMKSGALKHNQTVFLEDRHHDWRWQDGKFWYYSRVTQKSDVLVVYELENR